MKVLNKWKLYEKLGYVPNPGQLLFHKSEARFKVLCAGSRFGKTYSAVREVLPYILTPNTRGWIAAPTYNLAEKEFRQIHDDIVITLGIKPRSYSYNVKTGQMMLRFPWGSSVEAKSAERPESLLGEELDWCICAEGAQIQDQVYTRYIRMRLTSRNGKLIVPTTPAGYGGWVNDLWDRGQDPANKGNVESWQFPTWMNPRIPVEEIEDLRRTLSEDEFAEQVEGKFVRFSGLVYKEFDLNVHKIPWFEPSHTWRREAGVDFGYVHPFVSLWGAFDYDGAMYVYDELVQRGMTMVGIAEMIKARNEQYLNLSGTPVEIDTYHADPSARQEREELMSHDIITIEAENNVPVGIERVRQRLKVDSLTGKPRIYIMDNCVNTLKEFQNYHYKPNDPSELPEKKHDDCMDALRYLCAGKPDATFRPRQDPSKIYNTWDNTLRFIRTWGRRTEKIGSGHA